MKTRKWTDQQGVEKYTTEVHAREMQFLGGKGDNSQVANSQQPNRQAQQSQQPQQPQSSQQLNTNPQQQNHHPASFDDFDNDQVPF
jgi:single-strand DNA-binding protein